MVCKFLRKQLHLAQIKVRNNKWEQSIDSSSANRIKYPLRCQRFGLNFVTVFVSIALLSRNVFDYGQLQIKPVHRFGSIYKTCDSSCHPLAHNACNLDESGVDIGWSPFLYTSIPNNFTSIGPFMVPFALRARSMKICTKPDSTFCDILAPACDPGSPLVSTFRSNIPGRWTATCRPSADRGLGPTSTMGSKALVSLDTKTKTRAKVAITKTVSCLLDAILQIVCVCVGA